MSVSWDYVLKYILVGDASVGKASVCPLGVMKYAERLAGDRCNDPP